MRSVTSADLLPSQLYLVEKRCLPPRNTTAWHPAPNSVESSSLLTVRLHRLNFYVVLRKLIPKLQAFSKSIQETPMVRFYSSIYSDDKMLIRQMSCDSAFHGFPTKSLPHIERRPNASASFPTRYSVVLLVSEIRSFWRNVMTFEAGAAEMPLH